MTKTWLVLDATFLAHRLRYTMSGLSHDGMPTSVSFGFLRDTLYFQERFQTKNIVFCFDQGISLRQKEFAGYKSARRAKYQDYTPEEFSELGEFREQIVLLKSEYLPELGFNNVLYKKGLEADDFIAAVCNSLKGRDRAIIIGSDKDLYQLLSPRVEMWNPTRKKMYTEKDLSREYHGISSSQWHIVKAIAGCNTDSIPGVKGVGEVTAAKFLAETINEKSKTYKSIISETEVWQKNLSLTKLPYPGTPEFEPKEDRVTKAKWKALAKRLGMTTLIPKEIE